MRSLSQGFIEALNNDEREYLAYADITLASGTELHLTNSEIWSGGFSYEEAVSSDDNFTALGSTIIGSATLIINNIYDDFSDYIFENAEVVLSLGMEINNAIESFVVGTYMVDEATYNGATIQLKLLDFMAQFDRPYSLSTLTYPASLGEIFTDVCLTCGVQPETFVFPRRNYGIVARPTDEAVTCRDILSWVATIAGCFAKCTPTGRMALTWFDYDYLDDVDIDDPTLQPWETGTIYDSHGVHYLYNLHSQNVSVDDIAITGVKVNVKTDTEEVENGIITFVADGSTEGYVISIDDNQLIDTIYGQSIADEIGHDLIATRFRKLNITQASDPSIQAGDVAVVWDRKGNAYKILVTRVAFGVGTTQTIVCGSDSPSRNSATQYSSATKTYVESHKLYVASKTTANSALDSAVEAGIAAREAQASAREAKNSADEALESAKSATNSANNALVQLSIVEDVAGTLSWISENGDFVLTNDDHVYAGVVYFINQNGNYIPISNPDPNANPAQEGWYILDVTESQSKYIMAHLAVTNAGLWVLPVDQIVTHALADSSGNLFVDSDDNILVDYSTKDPQHAPGYKVLLSAEETENFPVGMTIYDDTGQIVANYGLTVQIGAETGNHIMIDTDSVDIMSDEETYVAKFGVETVIYSTNGTELAHFGYGNGNSTTGTNTAPYYTLGERNTISAIQYDYTRTYEVGDLCIYDDKFYVCHTAVIEPETFDRAKWKLVIGNYSLAEGQHTVASGYTSHAEGYYAKAIADWSSAAGARTIASGEFGSANGLHTYARAGQFVIGVANEKDTVTGEKQIQISTRVAVDLGRYAFIIGNGYGSPWEDVETLISRSNAFTVDWDGNVTATDYFINKTSLSLGTYVASGFLTSNSSIVQFSIPTGRVFPTNAQINTIQFNVVARVGNSSGTGSYLISDGDTHSVALHSASNSNQISNANDTTKTITSTMWTKNIYGGTNIFISINGGSNYFFSGPNSSTAGVNGNINNQPVILYLSDIEVTITYVNS